MSSNRWIQFIKFGLVGVSNTAVSYTINIGTLLLLKGFRLSCDYIIANITAFLLSEIGSLCHSGIPEFLYTALFGFYHWGKDEKMWQKTVKSAQDQPLVSSAA